jgi:hypothetical protein
MLNIVDEIKFIRLDLADNFRTMKEEMASKLIVNGKFNSTRSVGKPRRRWEDRARRDGSMEYENEEFELGIEKNKGEC